MAWMDKTRNKIILVVAIVMALGAIAGVVYGVLTHTEGGLLRVCWHGAAAHYQDDIERGQTAGERIDECEEPEEIRWPQKQIPITVAVVAPSGELSEDSDDLQVASAVVRDINAQLGFQLFKLSKQREASLRFHPQAAYEYDATRGVPQVPGWATHSKGPGGYLRCDVHVRGGLSVRYAYRVAVHEFGHCGGLAHDPDDPSSVMYPFSEDDTDSDNVLPSRLTDNDLSLLRRYKAR